MVTRFPRRENSVEKGPVIGAESSQGIHIRVVVPEYGAGGRAS